MARQTDTAMWVNRFDLVGKAEVRGMRAELRSFRKVVPFQEVVLTPAHIFGLSLTHGASSLSRPVTERVGGFSVDGPLTYRPRSTAWEIYGDGMPSTNLVCFLDDERLDREEPVSDRCGVNDHDMANVLLMIRQEILSPGFATRALMDSLREVLVLKLLKKERDGRAAVQPSGALTSSELERVRDCIWSSRGNPPSVIELAALCNLSPRTLLRRFKLSTGQSPSAYIAEIQYAKSQWLLQTSQLSLKEIAFETGFATASQFSRAFKRHSGLTPGDFRGSVRGLALA